MKIDKKTIDSILKLNDDQLWNVISIMISKSGNKDLKEIKRPSDMTALRKMLSSMSDSDIEKAMALLKKEKTNGN